VFLQDSFSSSHIKKWVEICDLFGLGSSREIGGHNFLEGVAFSPMEITNDRGKKKMTPESPRFQLSARARFLIGTIIVLGILLVRLALCVQPPVKTIDLARNLLYGELVLQDGPGVANRSLLECDQRLDKATMLLTFSGLAYQYPVVTLMFFTLMAAIWPSFFFVKLILTLIEVCNALLVIRFSKDRLLGLIYWANPISIWWVSREGQFEPLQNLCVISALVLLQGPTRRLRIGGAFVLLMLAIQVKLSPVLLIPLFVHQIWKEGPRIWTAALAGGMTGAALAPIGLLYYDWSRAAASMAFPINYYYWNPWHKEYFHGLPMSLRFLYAGLSWAVIGVLLLSAYRSRYKIAFLAPLALLFLFKIQPLVQPWYFLILPSFLLPIREAGTRRALTLWAGFLELTAVSHIIVGVSGWTNGGVFEHISVFEKLKTVPTQR
jgi:hypothetical protein